MDKGFYVQVCWSTLRHQTPREIVSDIVSSVSENN